MFLIKKIIYLFILIVLSIHSVQAADEPFDGIIAGLLEPHEHPLRLYSYETNYLIHSWTNNLNKEAIASYDWSNQAKNDETKFQISLGLPIWQGILGDKSVLAGSYTQRSWWQSTNTRKSSPFRETNYEPQLFLGWSVDYQLAGWHIKDLEFGFNHQSNGHGAKTSRSWNRIYARVLATKGNWMVELKPWWRIHEKQYNDDNPDISKYMGYYRVRTAYHWGEDTFSLQGFYNWSSGFGGGEAGWSTPLTSTVRFYVQVFSGYGESLIDYNFRQTRIGIGVMLNDIF